MLQYLLQKHLMKPGATVSKRQGAYTPVFDGRNQRVRGLWRRNDRFVARLTTQAADGTKKLVWHVLDCADTVPEAKRAMGDLSKQRDAGRLTARDRAPEFAQFVEAYLDGPSKTKRLATHRKERTHLHWWRERLGAYRLDRVNDSQVAAGLLELEQSGLAARTINLHAISLRNLYGHARELRLVENSPADVIRWRKPTHKERALISTADFERIAASTTEARYHGRRLAAVGEVGHSLRNAAQFGDYLRFLLYTGAREKEALRVRWADVNFDQARVTIGADGLSKNHEPRTVDFSPALELHLRQMFERRAPDSVWLFPSPKRGDRDVHAVSFRETLKMARMAAGLPHVGFHDTRHAFISTAVMAGIDFMTIARWVGHKDGGVLIGKVYGHVANDHRRRMASRMEFSA